MIAPSSLCMSMHVNRKLLVTVDIFLSRMIFTLVDERLRRTKGLEEVWAGANHSDIITARRLILFQCPSTDRSSIVPALRGFPRFPCVRNHPPTCCSRRRLQTMKPYTESLWAAGRCLMKDSVTAERITNARLLDTIRFAHTHTHTRMNSHAHANICRYALPANTPTQISTHAHTRHTNTLSCNGLTQPQGSRANGSWSVGGGEGGGTDGWMVDVWMDEEI